MYTTISAKISEEEREELKKLGLNPTVIIRKAVQDEIRKARNKDCTCIAQPNPHNSFLRILSISTNMPRPFNLHVDSSDAIYW